MIPSTKGGGSSLRYNRTAVTFICVHHGHHDSPSQVIPFYTNSAASAVPDQSPWSISSINLREETWTKLITSGHAHTHPASQVTCSQEADDRPTHLQALFPYLKTSPTTLMVNAKHSFSNDKDNLKERVGMSEFSPVSGELGIWYQADHRSFYK